MFFERAVHITCYVLTRLCRHQFYLFPQHSRLRQRQQRHTATLGRHITKYHKQAQIIFHVHEERPTLPLGCENMQKPQKIFFFQFFSQPQVCWLFNCFNQKPTENIFRRRVVREKSIVVGGGKGPQRGDLGALHTTTKCSSCVALLLLLLLLLAGLPVVFLS